MKMKRVLACALSAAMIVTFVSFGNMGVGMVIVVNEKHAEKVLDLLDDAYEIGEITEGAEKIILN